MSRRIRVLPDAVANQIAAGEVVERPASVVKELVENALDAGATRIEIEIERGGRKRIRVTDDGQGMSREDALLCLDRHATSKIAQASDLRVIRTLGFRGEALPSIAAVTRLSLVTQDAEGEMGTEVSVTGGTILAVQDAARRRGTTVEARDLFHNAPARREFLKATSAETRAVSEAVISVALSNPGTAISLRSDGRVLLELPATTDLAERIRGIWGTEQARELVPVDSTRDEIRVRGLVQRPDKVRPGHRKAYLFVENRPFRDPSLLRAVDRAYRTTVPPGHRPWVFLYLSVRPGSVDVNVHPAKAEVRFKNPAGVEQAVEDAIREALAGLKSSATLDEVRGDPTLPVPSQGRVRERPPAGSGNRADQIALFVSREGSASRTRADAYSGDAPGPAPGSGPPDPHSTDPIEGSHDGEPLFTIKAGRPRLWQVLNTYILAETRDGLLIIDQHSAHERILFEELMGRFETGGQEGQRLLFPLTVRLSPAEYAQVFELQGLLSRSGFEVEGFGGDTIIVQSVPNPHPYFDAERCFREMVSELTEGSELVRSARNQHERIAKTFACKGAIKAGQTLSESEMLELFDRLFATELPYHDVHGRPTIVRLSGGELERKFGR